MQLATTARVPRAIYGVPGFAPCPGAGYHALVAGETVFVPKEMVPAPAVPPTLQNFPALTVVTVEPSLTKKGPPVKGWSWKVSKNKVLAKQRLVTLAKSEASTSAAALANSFAALAMDPPSKPYFVDPFERLSGKHHFTSDVTLM